MLVPSKEQIDIINAVAPRILIEANAGSAKTTTAAMRIQKLVERGVDPAKIVALAYSTPGVRAYTEAFYRIGMPDAVSSKVRVGTVDALCATRLKRVEATVQDATPVPPVKTLERAAQVRPYVLQAVQRAREASQERFANDFAIQGTGALSVEHLLEAFAVLKGTLAVPRYGEDFRCTPAVAAELGMDYTPLAVFLHYERHRTGFANPEGERVQFRYPGDATYDMARWLLSENAPWSWDRHPLSLGIEAIVLDEMHDCGWAIFTVIRALLECNPGATFLGVGDRDQVIHAKNGADSYFLGPGLSRELGEVALFPLSVTRRFGTAIAGPLGMFAHKKYNADPAHASNVQVRVADGPKANADLVTQLIQQHKVAPDTLGDDLVVLLRHPGASVGIEHELLLKGMTYQTVGFRPFLQRPEIAFVRMLLAIAVDHPSKFIAPALLEAKQAVWELLGSNLSVLDAQDATDTVIQSATEDNFRQFVFPDLLGAADQATQHSIHAAVEIAATNDASKIKDFIAALDFNRIGQKIYVSEAELEEVRYALDSMGKVALQYSSIDAFLGAMNMFDHTLRKPSAAHRQLRLSTIEDAKGLEFRIVFIPDCNKKTFDNTSQDERNLFYVAASRAKELLVMGHAPGSESSYLKPFSH
ncbi:MAG: 3'-5' exonuclease [Rhodoferax sp.]|uniref:3'-5' exonuclease n=1 Tax=Rhodoferax sp. TaxID=50421 RepID=UPI002ACD303F|nr:3'-5' exonuclease [Rhodoferax sp.]MDZ7890539.1 3'-5' exonuclease [Rhodoferax sp.]